MDFIKFYPQETSHIRFIAMDPVLQPSNTTYLKSLRLPGNGSYHHDAEDNQDYLVFFNLWKKEILDP